MNRSPEAREMRQLAEQHIEAALDTLRHPRVVKEMGHYAITIGSVIENLYVPNLRNGVYSAPKARIHTEATPLIVTSFEQDIHVHNSLFTDMHPAQHKGLYELLISHSGMRLTTSRFNRIVRRVETDAQRGNDEIDTVTADELEGSLGFTANYFGTLSQNTQGLKLDEDLFVRTRPIIMLANDEPVQRGNTLIHESVHARQIIRDVEEPMGETGTIIHEDDEFEATSLEYGILKARHPYTYKPDTYTKRVEAVRRKAGDDREQLRRLMRSYGLGDNFEVLLRPKSTKKKNKHGRVGVKVNTRRR
jgi:hypothetical protein